MKILSFLTRGSNAVTKMMDGLAHLMALVTRFYLAYVFFWSGWLKVESWTSTLSLFTYEYKVQGLSPEMAAYIGTGIELLVPFFLVLGFGARLPAIVLFIFNVFTVLSYPILLSPEGACMVKDHYIWGLLIAFIILYGHGKWSVDHWLQKKVCAEYEY